jgi:D-serine deaminase-like pyridoxal phosphate-dependent protein
LLSGHEARTVAAVGWSGIDNGERLRRAAEHFDVLITADKAPHRTGVAEAARVCGRCRDSPP